MFLVSSCVRPALFVCKEVIIVTIDLSVMLELLLSKDGLKDENVELLTYNSRNCIQKDLSWFEMTIKPREDVGINTTFV